MPNINLLLSGAQFILSLIDLKQQLLTGTQHSNSFFRSNIRELGRGHEYLTC